MWKTILDLLFPIYCLGCGQEGEFTPSLFSKDKEQALPANKKGVGFICPVCFKEIPLYKEQPLKFSRESALAGLIIASDYDHPLVKQTIHRYKYDFIKDLAKPLGQLMVKQLTRSNKQLTPHQNKFGAGQAINSLLIPVPLHKKRLRWRGFNQAELLAFEVGQELNVKILNNILVRIKHRLPQVNIKSSKERKENIKQAFQLNPDFKNNLKDKTIILIDDISTTGATLEECALALRPLKPKEIWGLVVARG